MTHINYLIKEIDILPEGEFLLLWQSMQEKIQAVSNNKSTQQEKRPYGLCKGEFVVTDAFFEPLPPEMIDLFNGL